MELYEPSRPVLDYRHDHVVLKLHSHLRGHLPDIL